MSADVVILVLTALLAAVAVFAAVIAVRAVRALRETGPAPVVAAEPAAPSLPVVDVAADRQDDLGRDVEVVQGRVVALLTVDDLERARMSRPSVRARTYAAGLAHALRPESRDRITALVRREYRRRRSARLRAARRAMWTAVPAAPSAGEQARAVNE